MTYVPPKALSGRTPGISPDPYPWTESRLFRPKQVFSFLPYSPEPKLPVYSAAGWTITSPSVQGPYLATLQKPLGYTHTRREWGYGCIH